MASAWWTCAITKCRTTRRKTWITERAGHRAGGAARLRRAGRLNENPGLRSVLGHVVGALRQGGGIHLHRDGVLPEPGGAHFLGKTGGRPDSVVWHDAGSDR